MTRWWGVVLIAAVAGCGRASAPSDVSLNGRWKGTVGSLGVGFVTMDLTDTGSDVRGTGTWTPETGSGTAALTVTGIHIGANIQLTLAFQTPNGIEDQVLPGQITDVDAFYLVFPTEPTPPRITFTR